MDIVEIINKKKNGKILTANEIQFFVDGVCSGKIKDYQTTSLLMAICLNGMTDEETYCLTMSMARSGKMLNLDDVGVCVDKHSTGGVSDTTTLVVVPVLASLGIKTAKMSGRSLGFTGGTADKMEVFKGYNTEISTDKFVSLIKENNASIISQSADFALADKIIYKLRSDSGTVENLSLIASSIMSKKIACGAKIIVLDCKYGSGAFMKTKKDCKKLAKLMVEIGKRAGIKVCAVISSMQQPLTEFVGNNFEVYSSIKVLSGEKNNLRELSCYLASAILVLSERCKTILEAEELVKNAIDSGSAKQKLRQIVKSQGGDDSIIDSPETLLNCKNKFEVQTDKAGYISKIDTAEIGRISHDLQKIDGVVKRQDDVGIILNVKLGDKVNLSDKLATMYYNNLDDLPELAKRLKNCFVVGKKPKKNKLIECVIGV
jgi:pyrimidine-nucleoside phosphorylase